MIYFCKRLNNDSQLFYPLIWYFSSSEKREKFISAFRGTYSTWEEVAQDGFPYEYSDHLVD